MAVYVLVESVRSVSGGHPDPSWVGIGLAAVTAPTMPLLARAKRRVGHELGSSAAVSEGSQNMLCAYLSIALLIGLGANALLGWWWADPLASSSPLRLFRKVERPGAATRLATAAAEQAPRRS